ncbi:MAG: PilZ domain-containing protein [Myxococcota bacterium]
MAPEQRRHERKAFAVQFQAREAHGVGQLVFTSADLSAGGAFLTSDLLLEQGEPLSLEFSLPGQATPIRVQARVAWVRRFPQAGEKAGMGVEFVALKDEDKKRLEAQLA